MTSTMESPRAAETGRTHPVTLVAADGQRVAFECGPDQSVLEAAAAAGATLPASCRQGTCGSCHAAVLDGGYELGACSPLALPPNQRRPGDVLLCRTFPQSPLSVALPYASSRILYGGIPVRDAVITAMETVARDTVRLELSLNSDGATGLDCQFDPGQFMELQLPGQDVKRAYSLANTGNWDGRLEFYIRLRPDGLFSTYLREQARPGQPITVHGPQGAFGLHETGLRPRWFVAGGTGLTPLLSMLRHMAEWQEPQPARLFFGVNEEEDVFGVAELDAVAAELPDFTYEICVWRPGPSWPGQPTNPAEAVAAELSATPVKPDIYLCGPPPLVDAVAGVATAAGVPAEQIFHERFLAS
ncbi:MAG TPA: 2Fe-2S iron-sulfur cluster binding domain-containing protein [Micromonosporaceae bacterium]|nr:2Fe-2S iron-sulfur cluster binding domain-containing protein [Micromonosporaceae bacterium]